MTNDLVPVPAGGGVAVVDTSGGHVAYQSLRDMPRDVVLDSADREIAASFVTDMKAQGAAPAAIHQALRLYARYSQEQSAADEIADKADARDAQNSMREEWGRLYEANMRTLRQIFASLPPAVQEGLLSAQIADGALLLNTRSGLLWLYGLGMRQSGSGQSVQDELRAIEEVMRKDRRRYNRDEVMQARYRDLLDQQNGGR